MGVNFSLPPSWHLINKPANSSTAWQEKAQRRLLAEVEVACNLLRDGEALMEAVHQEVVRQGRARGVQVGEAYRIGKSPAQYAEMALQQLFK